LNFRMTKNTNTSAGSQSAALSGNGEGSSTQKAPPGNSQKSALPPSNKKKGKGVATQEGGESATADVFSAMAEIKAVLDRLSNKEAAQALTMLASLRNLRVVSMDRPIGQQAQSQAPAAKAEKVKGEGKTPPAAWRKTKQWQEAEEIHQGIVAQIKSEEDPTQVEVLRSTLREQEQTMKVLKQELQGKKPSA